MPGAEEAMKDVVRCDRVTGSREQDGIANFAGNSTFDLCYSEDDNRTVPNERIGSFTGMRGLPDQRESKEGMTRLNT